MRIERNKKILLVLGSLFFVFLFSMEVHAQVDSVNTDSLLMYFGKGIGTECFIVTIEVSDYSLKQNAIHPLEMVRGRAAGVSVVRRSEDPNEPLFLRIRGLTAFEVKQPLYVVDGYRVQHLDFINPMTIETIQVVKDVASTAKYGLLGSSGVIEITTNRKRYGNGINASYHGYVASSKKSGEVPVFSAQEYVEAGGNDLGVETNWQDLVNRKAISQVHNLAIQGADTHTNYYASGTVRTMEGILKKSGFDELGGQAGLESRFIDNRLTLGLDVGSSTRDISYSFVEANRYASVYNPTSPIYYENGEFFQAILFDNYNPLAIIEQNLNEGEQTVRNLGVHSSFQIIDELRLSVAYNRNHLEGSTGEFYASDSFFRGLNYDGVIRRSFFEVDFSSIQSALSFTKYITGWDLHSSVGIEFWNKQNEYSGYEIQGLYSDDFGYHLPDVRSQLNSSFTSSTISPKSQNLSYFLDAGFTYNFWLDLSTTLRFEEFNQLGIGGQTGFYPSVKAGVDLLQLYEGYAFTEMNLTAGYGKNGVLPNGFGYALGEQYFNYTTREFSHSVDPNSELSLAEISEFSTMLSFNTYFGLSGELEFYSRTMSDIIMEIAIPSTESQTGAYSQYQNVGELKTNGFEATLNYRSNFYNGLNWISGFTFSTYTTTLEDYSHDVRLGGALGAPGYGSTQMIKLEKGQEFGQFWGPVFDYVDADGYPIMKDVNGDGEVHSNPGDALNENGDFAVLGKATPDFELGWSNTFSYKNFGVDFLFRGVFGHSLVNTNRAHYEPLDLGAINSYNRTQTDKAVDNLSVGLYSSLYVEKADFVKLEHISFSYDFWFDNLKAIKNLTTYITVQNVFTLTNYTGVSPEPMYVDAGPIDNGGFNNGSSSVLSPGIDRRNRYLPSRTIMFGLKLNL